MSCQIPPTGRVAILLSTFNGGHFLPQQLESLLSQSYADWLLVWRDDGSTDDTVALMDAFAAGPGNGRCLRLDGPADRLGPRASFMALLLWVRDCAPDITSIAFADQDDVWLPEKLARGHAALAAASDDRPALYCARQILTDHALKPIGLSFPLSRDPGFPSALTQNIATGCTVMLNRAALHLVAATDAPRGTLHDWWCYLVVAGAGGALLTDATPTVLYRQHDANAIGAPRSMRHRAVAALRRGPAVFMAVFRQHVEALQAAAHVLSPQARSDLQTLSRALRGGVLDRARALRMGGLRRQTWPETLLFRWWFLLG